MSDRALSMASTSVGWGYWFGPATNGVRSARSECPPQTGLSETAHVQASRGTVSGVGEAAWRGLVYGRNHLASWEREDSS